MFFILFLLFQTVVSNKVIQNIDYIELYNNDYILDNSYNKTNIISNYSNIKECKDECSKDNKCVSIFKYLNNNITRCNLLNKIGEPIISNIETTTYLKINNYDYNNDKHTINGFIFESYSSYNKTYPTIIYLDLNYNGIRDKDEPYIVNKDRYGFFKFENISSGMYIIKQDPPFDCVQFYPSLNISSYYSKNIKGNGFIDKVISHSEHSEYNHGLYGGEVNSSLKIKNSNFSFILNNNSKTYLSFYDKYTITLSFTNEFILNSKGDDIFINTYLNSSTYAKVYVSHNNKNFFNIGILNNTRKSFDIKNIQTNTSIKYIKLDFYNDKHLDVPLNIIDIYGSYRSLYKYNNGYIINVPYNKHILFINDCNSVIKCNLYCTFNTYYNDDYKSCLKGCEHFRKYKHCRNQNHSDIYNEYFYENSCYYNYQRTLLPTYKLLKDTIGDTQNSIIHNSTKILLNSKELNRTNNVLNNMKIHCSNSNECISFSQETGECFLNHYYKSKIGYDLVVKISEYKQMKLLTTTSTSSSTTSLTSSSSTTSTTSLTSSSSTTSTTSTTSINSSSTHTHTITTKTITIITKAPIPNKEEKTVIGLNYQILYIMFGVIGFTTLIMCVFLCCLYFKKNNNNHINRVEEVRNPNQRFDNPLYDVSTEPTFSDDIDYETNENRPGVVLNGFYQDLHPIPEDTTEF